jgi:hypothetical protein
LHQQSTERELYFVHTAREHLVILERHWIGPRRGSAGPVVPAPYSPGPSSMNALSRSRRSSQVWLSSSIH